MKLYESKKLHYNKYLFKLTIPNQCASFFRTEFQKNGTLSYAKQKLDECNLYHDHRKPVITLPWGRLWNTISNEHYYDAITIYRYLKKNIADYLIRCEHNTLNIYCSDRKFLINLSNKLRNNFIEFWEPDPLKINLLLQNKNIILVKNKPLYEYKCTFGKKKGKPALAKWIENNPHLGKIGDVAKLECLNEGWVKGYYFFVRDEKALLMAQMIVGDNLQRIEQLVYTDK